MLGGGYSAGSRPAPLHGLGFLYHQADGSPDEGPEQRAHDNQELTTTAKRLVHRASKVEHPHYVAEAPRAQT